MSATHDENSTTGDVIDTPGLAEVVLMDRISSAAKARCDQLKSRLKPALSMFYVEEARRSNAGIPKTFRTEDGSAASATVQCRANGGKKPLTEDQLARLTKAGIRSLKRSTGKTYSINPGYLNDAMFITALRKLAADPKNGLPSDLILEEEGQVYTKGDETLMEVLRLPPKDAIALLDAVADIVVTKPMLDASQAISLLAKNPGRTDKPDVLDMLAAGLAPSEPEQRAEKPEARGRVAKRTAEVVPLGARGRRSG